jgi:predicted DNA-binding transcriptional regulator YafY
LNFNGNKGFRLLSIYERLSRGELVNKADLATCYSVTEKTVQRDIDDLRAYLADTHPAESEIAVKYDKARNGYFLVCGEREWLTNKEVLALCKISCTAANCVGLPLNSADPAWKQFWTGFLLRR